MMFTAVSNVECLRCGGQELVRRRNRKQVNVVPVRGFMNNLLLLLFMNGRELRCEMEKKTIDGHVRTKAGCGVLFTEQLAGTLKTSSLGGLDAWWLLNWNTTFKWLSSYWLTDCNWTWTDYCYWPKVSTEIIIHHMLRTCACPSEAEIWRRSRLSLERIGNGDRLPDVSLSSQNTWVGAGKLLEITCVPVGDWISSYLQMNIIVQVVVADSIFNWIQEFPEYFLKLSWNRAWICSWFSN